MAVFQPTLAWHQECYAVKAVDTEFADPQPVRAGAGLKVHYIPGRGKKLVVSLAGVGLKRWRVPPPEFRGTAGAHGEHHVLLISDANRTWMNGQGVPEEMVRVIERFRDDLGIEQVVTLGNSMGGVAALILAELTRVDVALSFSPQFSMDTGRVPEETRWRFWAQRMPDWRFPDVGKLSAPGTAYYIFHGAAEEEARHWMRFPWRREINHFIFHGMGHEVAMRLRKRQILAPAISAAIENRPRVVRRTLEREFLERKFEVYRREAYPQTPSDVALSPDGAPLVTPEVQT